MTEIEKAKAHALEAAELYRIATEAKRKFVQAPWHDPFNTLHSEIEGALNALLIESSQWAFSYQSRHRELQGQGEDNGGQGSV